MPRKKRAVNDPFAALETEVPLEPTEAIPAVLGRRPSRAKRNRAWETRHRTRSYRYIPDEVHQEIVAIAQQMHVPTGEIVRRLLEYGLEALREGRLALTPHPRNAVSMTLYPEERR